MLSVSDILSWFDPVGWLHLPENKNKNQNEHDFNISNAISSNYLYYDYGKSFD